MNFLQHILLRLIHRIISGYDLSNSEFIISFILPTCIHVIISDRVTFFRKSSCVAYRSQNGGRKFHIFSLWPFEHHERPLNTERPFQTIGLSLGRPIGYFNNTVITTCRHFRLNDRSPKWFSMALKVILATQSQNFIDWIWIRIEFIVTTMKSQLVPTILSFWPTKTIWRFVRQ